MVAISRFFSRFSWDVVGFSASAICAIHCLIVPCLLLFSSFSGVELLHHHGLETVILFFSMAIGSISLIPSLIKHHRKTLPLVLLAAGLSFIAIGRFDVPLIFETLFTTLGAVVVASAHYVNWKLCRPYHTAPASK